MKISSVVVADFVGLNGTDSSEGHYLAEEFTQRLDHYKKNFAVIDPKQLSSSLASVQISAKDLNAPETLQRIGSSVQSEAVVTGTFEASPAQYTVRLTVRTTKDSSVISSGEQLVKRPAYVDSLVFLDPGGSATKVARAGVDGVGVPTCLVCPPANYTDEARAAKIHGTVSLMVVITEEGHVGRIAVTKSSDDGLAKKAIEAVKKWSFRPATDKAGRPIAVLVPIEMSFSLY